MKHIKINKKLSTKEQRELISILKNRFESNTKRHKSIEWPKVQTRLVAHPEKLWSLSEMEKTGGEPDVIAFHKKTGIYLFCDCAEESPKERRSFCYDRAALDSRKEHKPKNNVQDLAIAMGVDLLTEHEYRSLQKLGNFDTKTSSWLMTPADIRNLGGAIFADRRYNTVFVYHNGAESYYAGRGFRALLKV
jgi:hypothetical protein